MKSSSVRVVLITTMGDRRVIEMSRASRSIGLRTIEMGLRARGFNDVHLFPAGNDYPFMPGLQERDRFKAELDALVDSSKRMVFGISTTTDDYFKFEQVARFLRENYPGSVIVGGGPHFKREMLVDSRGKRYRDPIEVALGDNLVDAAVVGHAQPFIDLVCEAEGQIDGVSSPGFFHKTASGQIAGQGRGRYPALDTVPYIMVKERFVDIVTDDSCANACGYCSVNRSRLGFSQEVILRTLREITRSFGKDFGIINFHDSNPFEPQKSHNLLETLDLLEPPESKYYPKALKGGLLDPSLFLDSKMAELVVKLAMHGFIRFFIGREVVTGKNAAAIEAKFRGKVKSADQLLAEKKALVGFIKALKHLKEKIQYPPVPFGVVISYIVTPFETRDSLHKMLDEMAEFEGASGDSVKVDTQYTILAPYPGTNIRRRYIDSIVDPEDYRQLSCSANVWSYALGPSAMAVEQMIMGMKVLMATESIERRLMVFQAAKNIIDKVFSGEIPLRDDTQRRGRSLTVAVPIH